MVEQYMAKSTTGTIHVVNRGWEKTHCGALVSENWDFFDGEVDAVGRDNYACSKCYWGTGMEEYGEIEKICSVCGHKVDTYGWRMERHKHLRIREDD